MTQPQQALPTFNVALAETGLPPAHPVNHFHMAFVGTELELTLAFVDIGQAIRRRDAAMVSGATSFELVGEVVARVVMSKESFQFLENQIRDIAARWITATHPG